MNDKNVTVTKNGGLGICSILTIIFVLLKAFGVINFTWFQCFLPLIIGIGVIILILLILLIIALVTKR
jgi:hypothetical protein